MSERIGHILERMAAAERLGMPAAVVFERSAGPVPAGASADLVGGLVPAYQVRGMDLVVLPLRARCLLLDGVVRPEAAALGVPA